MQFHSIYKACMSKAAKDMRRISFANVPIGMSRDDIRQTFGGFTGSFKKTPFASQETDNFGPCHVFYDDAGKCDAVEFFPEAVDQRPSENALEALKQRIPDLKEVEDGLWISKGSSVGITTANGRIKSILIGKPNYYDV